MTALRLVRFAPGSGVVTIEPDRLSLTDDQSLPLEEVPLAIENLRTLVDDIETGAPLSEPVTDALSGACRSLGNDGSIAIDFPPHIRRARGTIDLPRLEGLRRTDNAAPEEIRTVSGRLHLLDVEPDKLAIRTSSGVDWTCKYPEALEPTVKRLVDRIVWVRGAGQLTSPLRGAMTIEQIEVAEQGEQSTLFTTEPTPDAELLARQGIVAPQGLARLADPEWDEEADEPYLEALTGR